MRAATVALAWVCGCSFIGVRGAPSPLPKSGAAIDGSSAKPRAAPRDPKTKELADKAYERAKAGNCATVEALSVAIRDGDPEYYARVFLVDPVIKPCRGTVDSADDNERARALTLTAVASANSGDCASVKTIDVQVRDLDADFHEKVFVHDVAIAKCLIEVSSPPTIQTTTLATAQPTAAQVDAAAKDVSSGSPALDGQQESEPPRVRCDTGLYLEPSMLFPMWKSTSYSGPKSAPLLDRLAAGLLFRRCRASGGPGVHVHVGATWYAARLNLPEIGDHWASGAGLEAELDYPVSAEVRVGGRLGAETATGGSPPFDTKLFTFGVRLYATDALSVGLDVFHLGSTTGVMAGIAAAGSPGAYIGGVEIVLGLLAVAALSNQNW